MSVLSPSGVKRKLEDGALDAARYSPSVPPFAAHSNPDMAMLSERLNRARQEQRANGGFRRPDPASHSNVPSRISSSRASPTPPVFGTYSQLSPPTISSRNFDPDASLVLIGTRGCGKSSLGVIVSKNLGRRLVDADQYFLQATGLSRTAFSKEHDAQEYRARDATVMRQMLAEHSRKCVITCGPIFSGLAQSALRDYCKDHPVIHVVRDKQGIQEYLPHWSEEKVSRLLKSSGPMHRSCSNLEFYNLSERLPNRNESPPHDPASRQIVSTSFLLLKNVEQDFLRFVQFLREGKSASHPIRQPEHLIPLNARMYTYSLSLPLSVLVDANIDLRTLLDSSAEMIEIQIDTLKSSSADSTSDHSQMSEISQQFSRVRRETRVPICCHIDRTRIAAEDDVSSAEVDEIYFTYVRHALRLAPEFLTLDLDCNERELQKIMEMKGFTKIIGHYSDPSPGSQGWDRPERMAKYEQAKTLGCALVRITQPALTMEDNISAQRFLSKVNSSPEPRLPTIAFNTGLLGRMSCFLNPIYTSVSHPILDDLSLDSHISLPSLTLKQAQEALHASFVIEKKKFCIFGASVTYSLSPAMQNAAYHDCGLPHEYSIRQTPHFRDIGDIVSDPQFGGASIVLPYKTEIIPLLHSLSPDAKAIGAVNTIIRLDDGKPQDRPRSSKRTPAQTPSLASPALYGDNTDWIGIRSCVSQHLSPANSITPQSTGLIIGAGGMARAAVYALIRLGVKNIFIWNRTISNAERLAEHYANQSLPIRDSSQFAARAPFGTGFSTPEQMPSSPKDSGRPLIAVLRGPDMPWPDGFRQPTIIVSCVPGHAVSGGAEPNVTVPVQWLQSPTGGVVLDVSPCPLQDHPSLDPILTRYMIAILQTSPHSSNQTNPRRITPRLYRRRRPGISSGASFCAV